jgi:hypothetical protein
MVKGLTSPSSPITVSFSVAELLPNTYQENRIPLQLNVLDREVFVITGVNLDVLPPQAIAGVDTRVRGQLSVTSMSGSASLSTSNVVAVARDDIRAAGFVDGGVGFSSMFGESPAIGMDYLAICATNDFFVAVEGSGLTGPTAMTGKLYGFRAIADGATFAALTQSELLSA